MERRIELSHIRSRPRFKIKTNLSQEEFLTRLEKHFRKENKLLGGYIHKETSIIRLREQKEEYWAPQLQIRTESDDDKPSITVIRGIFGPKPAVWTFFMFLYFLGGTLVTFFGMIYFVQMRLNLGSWMVIGFWIGIAILAITWFAAQMGQRIAKRHLQILRNFMEKVVHEELEDDDIEDTDTIARDYD
ncbi:MAG: hypothetical protein Q4F57_06105 [Weeksellaceae bacterium]|nr:hypothetical protein [Weeksellaceae bacterium]